MRIALAQKNGCPANVPANLETMERTAAEAAAAGGHLAVFPELFLTGYNIGASVTELAESVDGPSARSASRIARTNGIAIAYGYPERAAAGVYDSVMVLDRTGAVVANYRKIHLWGGSERRFFLPGEGNAMFPIEGATAGLLVCYDLDFPESARCLALSGADIIVAVSAIPEPYNAVPRHVVPARAYENRLFVVFANRTGQESGLRYMGESCIAAPDGTLLARCGTDEALVTADVDLQSYSLFRHENDCWPDRRPELYHP